jgi:AcrR family transcriptional regulator
MARVVVSPARDDKRRRYNRDAEIHAAAIRVFWAKGFHSASIQDIADEVGVLKGSLYYYFQSKEELLFRIFDESHEQASKIRDDVLALGASPLETLRRYFEGYCLWYLRNMERVALYSREWKSLTGERLEQVRQQRRSYDEFIMGLIGKAKAAGEVPENVNEKYATFFVLGAVNGIPDWYRSNLPGKPEAIAATYGELLIATLTGG